MSRQVGTVESVEVRFAGGSLLANAPAGASTLTLDVAVDFEEDGGRLTVNETTYDYTVTDHDLDTVTLAIPLAAPAETADPVRALDALGNAQTERVVWVDVEDGETIPAEVPTQLAPYFPEGVAVAGQLVEVELVTARPTSHGVDGSSSWRVLSRPVQEAVFEASVRTTDEFGAILSGVGANGVVTAQDLYYGGSFTADTSTMVWDGISASEMLALLPKGLLRWGVRTPNVTKVATEYAVMSLVVHVPRDCESLLALNGRIQSNTAEARFQSRVRYTYNADAPPPAATNASPILAKFDGSAELTIPDNTAGVAGQNYAVDRTRGIQLRAGWYDLRWTLEALGAGITLDTQGDFAMHVYDQGPALMANGAKPPVAPGTLEAGGTNTGSSSTGQVQYYTNEYAPTANAYWGTDTASPLGTGPVLFFGNSLLRMSQAAAGSTENMRAVIWFNGAKMASDLVGATITRVQLYLFLHAGNSENTVVLGTHTDPTVRTTYGAVAGKVVDRVRSADWSQGSGRWIDLPFALQSWKGTFQGIVIGPAPETGAQWTGGVRGLSSEDNRPLLRIEYTR